MKMINENEPSFHFNIFARELFFIYEALKRYFLHYIKERLIFFYRRGNCFRCLSEGSTGKGI